MRLRLLALLPTVLLLVFLIPAPDSAASAGEVVDTVVDEMDDLSQAGRGAQGSTQVSSPVQTPIEFSMLAFTAPPGAEISFRTSVNGANWTPWTPAEEPEGVGPDHGTDEALGAAPDHRRSGVRRPAAMCDSSTLSRMKVELRKSRSANPMRRSPFSRRSIDWRNVTCA